MRTLALCLLAACAAYAAPAPSVSLDLAAAKSKVEFLAIGRPSMLKIRGTAKPKEGEKALEGTLKLDGDKVTGKAAFLLDSLETGISLRDRHMKEKYLETAKHPKAEFTLTELILPPALKAGDGEAKGLPFKGKLKVHGVETEVTGTSNVERKSGNAEFEFAFATKIPSHQIELPSFMGVTVAENVEITVEVEGPLK